MARTHCRNFILLAVDNIRLVVEILQEEDHVAIRLYPSGPPPSRRGEEG
jgi:hypothetical protein